MKTYHYGGVRYIVAQDPDEDEDLFLPDAEPAPEIDDDVPSESELVEDIEEEPGTDWRDRYLQPIIRMIRSLFDLEKGQVALLGPRKTSPFGSDPYGFRIEGHVRFEDFDPGDDYGTGPYRFEARVGPDGELAKRIEIRGQDLE